MYTESRPPEVTLKFLNSRIEIDSILFLFRENRDEYIFSFRLFVVDVCDINFINWHTYLNTLKINKQQMTPLVFPLVPLSAPLLVYPLLCWLLWSLGLWSGGSACHSQVHKTKIVSVFYIHKTIIKCFCWSKLSLLTKNQLYLLFIFIINILEIDWDVATLKHTSDYVLEYKLNIQYNNVRYESVCKYDV